MTQIREQVLDAVLVAAAKKEVCPECHERVDHACGALLVTADGLFRVWAQSVCRSRVPNGMETIYKSTSPNGAAQIVAHSERVGVLDWEVIEARKTNARLAEQVLDLLAENNRLKDAERERTASLEAHRKDLHERYHLDPDLLLPQGPNELANRYGIIPDCADVPADRRIHLDPGQLGGDAAKVLTGTIGVDGKITLQVHPRPAPELVHGHLPLTVLIGPPYAVSEITLQGDARMLTADYNRFTAAGGVVHLNGYRLQCASFPIRGVDAPCEECGKLDGSTLDNGWYRCHSCGYPAQ